jgi:putative DNA primase/helicase
VPVPQAVVGVDRGTVIGWLNELFGLCPGLINICSTSDWVGRCFDLDTLEQAADYVEELDRRGAIGIYHRVTTLIDQPPEGERGSTEMTMDVIGMWADMDVAGPGHKEANLPPDRAHCAHILTKAGLPEPTYWISSGGGFYPYWLLDNPWTVYGDTEVASRFCERWQRLIGAASKADGYAYGTGVGDLPRVLRMPGTTNRKVEGQPRPCVEVGGTYDADGMHRYTLEELAQALGAGEARFPAPVVVPSAPTPRIGAEGRISDDYNNNTSLPKLMTDAGWTCLRAQGPKSYWVGPGSTSRDHSAVLGHDGTDRLFVFGTSSGLEADRYYDAFEFFTFTQCGGNFKEAARTLARAGFGTQRSDDPFAAVLARPIAAPAWEAVGQTAPLEPTPPTTNGTARTHSYLLNDRDNARRMYDTWGERFLHVPHRKQWLEWDGKRYTDGEGVSAQRLEAATEVVGLQIFAEANRLMENGDPEDKDLIRKVEKMKSFATNTGNDAKVKSMVASLAARPGVSVSPQALDPQRHLLNVGNGVLNLATLELTAHDPSYRMTKLFGAGYDPAATCPKFDRFISEVFPVEATRRYVQKAMAYTMLGDADQKVAFMLHGPSNTGKSQLTELMRLVFGDYGAAAASATFRARRGDGGPTNDVNDLQGTRFVTCSETGDNWQLDEDMLKRITGRDEMKSRRLYCENESWTPQCVPWFVTNQLPTMRADDNAIWTRVKAIPMTVVFDRTSGRECIRDLARTQLFAEADGILNWLLEGLAAYRSEGLEESAQVLDATEAYRLDSDSVAQYINEAKEEHSLVPDDKAKVLNSTLFAGYERWCEVNRIKPLGIRRFASRVEALWGKEAGYRVGGVKVWQGWSHQLKAAPMIM